MAERIGIPTDEQVATHVVMLDGLVRTAVAGHLETHATTDAEARAAVLALVAVLSGHLQKALDLGRKVGIPSDALEASSGMPLLILQSPPGGDA